MSVGPEEHMFGLFAPSCPLGTAEKTWVERRMLWLAGRFGIDRLRRARVVAPTPEYFPDPYTADPPSARQCLDRVCEYMGLDPGAVTLEVLPDEYMPGAAGWYEMRGRAHICIASSQLADPTRLVATLAHEVAHELLLRGGHLTGQEIDHEQATDLLPAFLGVGIFAANGTLRTSSGWEANMSWWSISVQGYLPSQVHGYALALAAYVRGTESGERYHLGPDPCGAFKSGLRYLLKTGDALFTPETAGRPQPAPTPESVLAELASPSPTVRVCALWHLVENGFTGPQFVGPVSECLSHRDADVRAEAAWALAGLGEAARPAVPRLLPLLADPNFAARSGAVRVLGQLRAAPEAVVPELVRALGNPDFDRTEVAEALAAYGPAAAPALPRLVERFALAASSNDQATSSLARALASVCPDPRRAVREHFGGRDPDALRLALGELTALETDPTDPRYEPPPVNIATIPLPRPPRLPATGGSV